MIHVEFTIQRRHLIVLVGILMTALMLIPGVAWASNQFNDVPDSNIFHDDITWLADAGVTLGCGGGNFCPDAPVTRGQMAAFMHRFSQNMIGTRIMTASVSADGSPYAGGLNGPTSVTRSNVGHYIVTFDRDVTNCVAVTSDLLFSESRDVSADPISGTSNEIFVRVRNADDTNYVDTWWSMTVVCPEDA